MKKKIINIISCGCIFLISIVILNCNDDTRKMVNYNGDNLRISIDGEVSNTLPTSDNYYLVDYDCKSSSTKIDWDRNNYKLNITNGTKNGGVSCYLEFKSNPLLNEVSVGSYVAYTGDSNNGCDDTNTVDGYTSCGGKNANYVSSLDMGYCNNSNNKFHVNGWRIGYIENGSAYLISAGATDCMCTSAEGTLSNSNCTDYLTNSNLYKHIDNMNNVALKYCNNNYSNGGVCDQTTSWAMNENDFEKMLPYHLEINSCYILVNKKCGYTNDLIDNGGYYWYSFSYGSTVNKIVYWNPKGRFFAGDTSDYLNGVRPVLALASSVIVTGGDGTYESPYLIGNNSFRINANEDLSQVQFSMNAISDVSTMCISVDTSVCTNYIDYSDTYTLDWSSETDGEKIVYVYYKDSNGDIVASMSKSITIDTTS